MIWTFLHFILKFDISGHYVPQLSELIFDNNLNHAEKDYINFKGFMVKLSHYITFHYIMFYIYIITC